MNVDLEQTVNYLLEDDSKAAAEAKRRGLKSIGFGRYVHPQDPKTVIAKVENGRLVLTSHGAKVAKKQGQTVEEPVGTKPGAPRAEPPPQSTSIDRHTSLATPKPEKQYHKPHKPASRGRGKTTPGGDESIKDRILIHGWEQGAPGNKGSAFNEILTGEGVHRILERPELVDNPDALTEVLTKEYGNTTLVKQNSDAKKKFQVTALAAIDEYKRVLSGLKSKEWDVADVKLDHYWGAKESKKIMLDRVRQSVENKQPIFAPNGKAIEPTELFKLVGEMGGGENPSDTAMFVDSDEGTMVFFTSNKLSTADQIANSRLKTEVDSIKNIAQNLVVNGEIPQSWAEDAGKTIDRNWAAISGLESDVEPLIFAELTSLALKNPNIRKGFVQSLRTKQEGTVEEKGRLSNLKRWENFKKLVGEQDDMNAASKFFHMIQSKELPSRKFGAAHVGKLISRQLRGVPGVPSAQSLTAKVRGKIITHLSNLRKELNRQKTRSGKPLGDFLEAKNIISRLHLSGALGNKGNAIDKYDGLFAVNAGGTRIDNKKLGQCLGGQNEKEFIAGFAVSEPIPMKDEEGNVTGARYELFQVDRGGQRHRLAAREVRSKQGATGKLETSYKWTREMRDCFKS